jgi:hypothetical protein
MNTYIAANSTAFINTITNAPPKSAPTLSLAPIIKSYGDASFVLSPSSNSTGAFSYSSSNTSVATVSGNTVNIIGVGSSTITVDQAEDANYNASQGQVTALLTVARGIPIITFPVITNGVYYDTVDLFATSTNPFSPIIYEIVNNPEIASIEGNRLTFNGFGTVSVVAFQMPNEFYESVSSIRTFTRVSSPSHVLTSLAVSVTTDSVTHEEDIPLSSVKRLGNNSVIITNQNIINIFNQNPGQNLHSIKATYNNGERVIHFK